MSPSKAMKECKGKQKMVQEQGSSSNHNEALNRQSSSSLTFEDTNLKDWKNSGSMNIDEFLASMWNADNDVAQIKNNNVELRTVQQPPTAFSSSMFVHVPMSQITTNEIWMDIKNDERHRNAPSQPLQRKNSPEEITLEDFLIKFGVVQEAPTISSHEVKKSTQQLTHASGQMNNQNQPMNPNFGIENSLNGVRFLASPQTLSNNLVGANSGYQMYPHQDMDTFVKGNPTNIDDIELTGAIEQSSSQNGKRRIIDGPPSLVVERRKSRMIKNRESAARSRARKQKNYTTMAQNKDEESKSLRRTESW